MADHQLAPGTQALIDLAERWAVDTGIDGLVSTIVSSLPKQLRAAVGEKLRELAVLGYRDGVHETLIEAREGKIAGVLYLPAEQRAARDRAAADDAAFLGTVVGKFTFAEGGDDLYMKQQLKAIAGRVQSGYYLPADEGVGSLRQKAARWRAAAEAKSGVPLDGAAAEDAFVDGFNQALRLHPGAST